MEHWKPAVPSNLGLLKRPLSSRRGWTAARLTRPRWPRPLQLMTSAAKVASHCIRELNVCSALLSINSSQLSSERVGNTVAQESSTLSNPNVLYSIYLCVKFLMFQLIQRDPISFRINMFSRLSLEISFKGPFSLFIHYGHPCAHIAPGIPNAIQAEAINSTAVRVITWSSLRAGACIINYDVCLCTATSINCNAAALNVTTPGENCIHDLAEGVLFRLFIWFLANL